MASFAKALAAKAQSQLAKAEELLNQADRRTGERIVKVREIAGMTPQPQTPAPAPQDDGVVVSSAVAALLAPEERRGLRVDDSAPTPLAHARPNGEAPSATPSVDGGGGSLGGANGGDAASTGRDRTPASDTLPRTSPHAAASQAPSRSASSEASRAGAATAAAAPAPETAAPPQTPTAELGAAAQYPSAPSSAAAYSSCAAAPPSASANGHKQAKSEWLALQQELQIVAIHGRRLHSRLQAQRANLDRSRAAEAAAAKQAMRQLVGRAEAAEAAERRARTASDQHQRAAAALDAARAEAVSEAGRARAEAEAQRREASRLAAALAGKAEALSRFESGYGLQTDGIAAMREQQRESDRAAEAAAEARSGCA
jgi:hypothetical protein